MMRKQWFTLIVCLLFIAPLTSQAAPLISINNLSPVVNIQLTPQELTSNSTITRDIDFCVVANTNNPKNPKRMKFDIEIDGSTSNSDFLLHNGNTSVPIGFKMASYYDKNGNSIGLGNFKDLQPAKMGQLYTGALSCDGSDGNYGKSRLRITFNTSSLSSTLAAGTYTQQFTVKEDPNGKANAATAPLTVNLIMLDLVQISRLNNLILYNIGGGIGYGASEDFCVYSSTGDFLIKADGQAADNDQFILHNGSQQLSYTVDLGRNDGFGQHFKVSPGEKVDISVANINCNIQDNSQVRIVVNQQAIDHALSGTYSGVLRLTVEPT